MDDIEPRDPALAQQEPQSQTVENVTPQLAEELQKLFGEPEPQPAAVPPSAENSGPVESESPVNTMVAGVMAQKPQSDVPAQPTPQPLQGEEPAAETSSVQETETMASSYDFTKMQEGAQQQAAQFQQGVQQAADTVRQQSEEAIRQGQQAMAQVTERSREAMDRGMKAFDDFNVQARGSADAWVATSKAAAQGLEQVVQQAAEFSRKTFETATAAMRTMASARTPQEVMQAQNDFAKAQFDTIVSEFSRLTETMMKVSNTVLEPIQSHMATAATKAGETVKSAMGQR